jgi:hypothetical protein
MFGKQAGQAPPTAPPRCRERSQPRAHDSGRRLPSDVISHRIVEKRFGTQSRSSSGRCSPSHHAAPFGLPSGAACLSQFLQFSFDFGCGVSDVLHGFGQPLFRNIELVSPVLHFMRLKKADPASVLWTPVGEIVRHAFPPIWRLTRLRVGMFPASFYCGPFESAAWPAARGKASPHQQKLLRQQGPGPLDSPIEIPHFTRMCNRFRSIKEWSDIPPPSSQRAAAERCLRSPSAPEDASKIDSL